uniref:Basic helix-loop-helix transcription factor 2 n=1 Tax=Scoparia dulcis TaxID=107240 RepID=A0A7G1KYE9_SCODU|nr:basic helix-loop-helix transcription factor 2 [Scoparia dulcis]
MEMRNWFPLDFSRQAGDQLMPIQPSDQNQPPSSSSSSLRSLSVDSPEYSPLLFNIPTTSTSFIPEPAKESIIEEAFLQETLIRSSSTVPMSTTTTTTPHQEAIHSLSQIRAGQLPTIESEDAAMTKAILAVLSSPATTSSSVSHQNFPPISHSNKPTAFRSYRAALAPIPQASSRKHNMFRRALGFLRNLNLRRRQELQIQGNRPTSTQLHHMISERRRREKLNESFQILRSLLPPGSKKDKASVLSSTTEYLSSLKSQVAELQKKNEMLEAELFASQRKENEGVGGSSSAAAAHDHQRLSVEIENNVAASTSNGRFLDLRVRVRGECSTLDMVIQILEFLKRQRNVSLLSVESNTRMIDSSTQEHSILLRLKVEGDEFDEAGFQEAVRRVVDDLAH